MQPSTAMQYVTSNDGTKIGIEVTGRGPAVVLVCGGSVDRGSNAGLAAQLAPDFTVYNYDRRGRGDSGDTPPYAIEREIEDIGAVITAAGGTACLYGTSSGAALALLATGSGLPVTKLALWEPPYIRDPAARPPADQVQRYETMIAEGRPEDAAEYFMAEVVRMPAEFVAFAKTQPFFQGQVAIAHTLAYDARIMGDYSLPLDLAATVTVPTITIAGGGSMPFMLDTAKALADALPNGQTRTLPDQEHNIDPAVIAPVLKEFFDS